MLNMRTIFRRQKTAKTWQRTKHQNLIRHKSGGYYARAYANGKEIWQSLKTSHLSMAQAKLAEFLKEHRERVSNGNGEVSAKMSFAEAAAMHLRNLDENLSIKPRTRDYWRECLAALQKSWPGLNETEVRKITRLECKEWARAYGKAVSPTRYNNTLSVLRHVLNVAVEAGVVYGNVAAARSRKDKWRTKLRRKQLSLRTVEQFNAMIAEIRAGHSRDSINCADFASGLAFTGCRVGEAREIAWRDVDFDAGEVVVRGDPSTGTKNGELRRVPLFPMRGRCSSECASTIPIVTQTNASDHWPVTRNFRFALTLATHCLDYRARST